jgi:hypothetical protein
VRLVELRLLRLKLTPNGERLIVEPASLLTDELRAAIKAHKPELLRELANEARPHHRFPAWTRSCYGERRVRRRREGLRRVGIA